MKQYIWHYAEMQACADRLILFRNRLTDNNSAVNAIFEKLFIGLPSNVRATFWKDDKEETSAMEQLLQLFETEAEMLYRHRCVIVEPEDGPPVAQMVKLGL